MSRALDILEMVLTYLPEEGEDEPEEQDQYDLQASGPGYRYQNRGPGSTTRFPDGKRPAGLSSKVGFSS